MKTQKQSDESKQIRTEANYVVDDIRKQKGLAPLRKELKPLVNFEADDIAPAFETLFGSERSQIATISQRASRA